MVKLFVDNPVSTCGDLILNIYSRTKLRYQHDSGFLIPGNPGDLHIR